MNSRSFGTMTEDEKKAPLGEFMNQPKKQYVGKYWNLNQTKVKTICSLDFKK
jgi:hypothetical protein